MRVIARKALKDFWARYPDSEQPLKAWYKVASSADWKSPHDVKACYQNASILPEGRVVFNIAVNKYRLVAQVNYPYRVLYIRFVGTHEAYDRIDARKV
ncbi:MAG TPA: type II toxin-antitoxin system HigB family toxin [Patescibacteria group bacterium]|nr:type II toxin-antitoxin system HigB family toxin [Patescibacteria group bacterium]